VHGEDTYRRERSNIRAETPPRAWGRPSKKTEISNETGNTPTCMGKTTLILCSIKHAEKHPHVHGEDSPSISKPKADIETPPRAWGRLINVQLIDLLSGNTPTCMGKTWMRARRRRLTGETPPRAWGRPRPPERYARDARNTPTCMGKTAASRKVRKGC